MGVCNLLTNNLDNASGNFLMFSQYVEDVTRNYSSGDDYKVVPSRFIALNIDYSKINKSLVLNNNVESYNTGIPKYFQNCFENACAYGRANYKNWSGKQDGNGDNNGDWSPNISKNLFWNYMFDGGFMTAIKYGSDTSEIKYSPEIVYFGDINMHAYNEHQGMGYGEIYCYIPTDGERMRCQVERVTDIVSNDRLFDGSNKSSYLEGYPDISTDGYPQSYYYNDDFKVFVDTSIHGKLNNSSEQYYDINTIVVLYSVFQKVNETWSALYEDIPMGIYFAGNFNTNDKLTNVITKYVTTSYGTGTAYGLRICTRFSATSNGRIINTDIVSDDTGYVNMCQLMTAMNENLSKMLEVTKTTIDTRENYKELLSIFKNNKTNVPYVKTINGTEFWFVNGKMVATVAQNTNSACGEIDESTIKQRIENLKDNDPNNDWTYIETPGVDECFPVDNKELATELGLNPDNYVSYGGGTTGAGAIVQPDKLDNTTETE